MSKALGGTVSRNPVKEIGWGEVSVADSAEAQRWFGHAAPAFRSFHWHGETFTIPPGAKHLLSSAYCANQAFSLGNSLGMQCHIEMTPEMIASWCESGAREIARSSDSPGVQQGAEIMTDLDARLRRLHAVADGVYARWLENLRR
jgi:GMP synthase-like glutamine amidotransferase